MRSWKGYLLGLLSKEVFLLYMEFVFEVEEYSPFDGEASVWTAVVYDVDYQMYCWDLAL